MSPVNDEVFLDIETVPTQDERIKQALSEELDADLMGELAGVKAPGNYKDEAKIAEFIANRQREIVAEADAKKEAKLHATGLDGAYGEVYCLGFAVNDGEPLIVGRGHHLTADAERDTLKSFFEQVGARLDRRTRPVLIGHNIANFDIRFIYQRAMVLGVRPPHWLYVDAKPWDECIFDTMVKWAGPRDRVSLSKLCRAFGIEDTDTISGKDVWACIQRGEHERVEEHCRIDIDKTRRIYRRMTFAG